MATKDVTPETAVQSPPTDQGKIRRARHPKAPPKAKPKGSERIAALNALPKEIRSEHEAIVGLMGDIVTHAVVAGEKLLYVKALQQGNFETWCKNNLKGISFRTCQVYMRIASPAGQDAIAKAKAQHAAPLSLRSIIAALTTPKPGKPQKQAQQPAVAAEATHTQAVESPGAIDLAAMERRPATVTGSVIAYPVADGDEIERAIKSIAALATRIMDDPTAMMDRRSTYREQLAHAQQVIEAAIAALNA